MPIYQPIQRLIHSGDFRDKVYYFEVESALTSQERIGVLTVSAPAGYLLATSSNNEFRREQVIEHILQEDGNWIAKASVTLILAADSFVDGTLVIRNSVSETLTLLIDVTSTISLTLLQQPSLTVNESVLSFSQTSLDKPSFAVLTIAQQHSEVPVTLTTNTPEYFQLASDSHPAFSPTLTIIPSSTGTYVHVRYSASKSGVHADQLTIQNSFGKRTVMLEGRSSGLLPYIRANPLRGRQVKPLRMPERLTVSKRWAGILSCVIISGLAAYAGYANRCQLFPALCQAPEMNQSNAQEVQLVPALVHETTAPQKIAAQPGVSEETKRKRLSDPFPNSSSSSDASSGSISQKQVVADAVEQASRVETETPESSGQQPKSQGTRKPANPRPTEPVTPPASADESELERTLNQKTNP